MAGEVEMLGLLVSVGAWSTSASGNQKSVERVHTSRDKICRGLFPRLVGSKLRLLLSVVFAIIPERFLRLYLRRQGIERVIVAEEL